MLSRLQLLLGVSTRLRGALRAAAARLKQAAMHPMHLQATSGTTLALTGILGLAAVVYALYQLRGGPGVLR